MNKTDYIGAIAEKTGFTKKSVGEVLPAVFEVIKEALVAGDFVQIADFGKFDTTVRAARTVRNPLTGGVLEIPETRVVKFKPSANLKEAVKGE